MSTEAPVEFSSSESGTRIGVLQTKQRGTRRHVHAMRFDSYERSALSFSRRREPATEPRCARAYPADSARSGAEQFK